MKHNVFMICVAVAQFNGHKVTTTLRYLTEQEAATLPTITFCNIIPFTSNFSLQLLAALLYTGYAIPTLAQVSTTHRTSIALCKLMHHSCRHTPSSSRSRGLTNLFLLFFLIVNSYLKKITSDVE